MSFEKQPPIGKRLTEYFEIGNYTEKENIIDVSDKLPLFENGVVMGKAIDKLAEFEDFLEEHNCETLDEYTKKVILDSKREICEYLVNFIDKNSIYSSDFGDVIHSMSLIRELDKLIGEKEPSQAQGE